MVGTGKQICELYCCSSLLWCLRLLSLVHSAGQTSLSWLKSVQIVPRTHAMKHQKSEFCKVETLTCGRGRPLPGDNNPLKDRVKSHSGLPLGHRLCTKAVTREHSIPSARV